MAANIKIDVRRDDFVEGLYKVNFINLEGSKEKIMVSIDCGIEALHLIRDTISNAIKVIEQESPVNSN